MCVCVFRQPGYASIQCIVLFDDEIRQWRQARAYDDFYVRNVVMPPNPENIINILCGMLPLSAANRIQLSDVYNKTGRTGVWYLHNFVGSDRHLSVHVLHRAVGRCANK